MVWPEMSRGRYIANRIHDRIERQPYRIFEQQLTIAQTLRPRRDHILLIRVHPDSVARIVRMVPAVCAVTITMIGIHK